MTNGTDVFIKSEAVEWEDIGGGVRRKILAYDKELMLVYVEFKKGSVGYVHKHHHTQVTYIERGSFEVQIGNEKKILGATDCYFIPSNVEHGVVALEDASLVDVFAPMREDLVQPRQKKTAESPRT